MDLLNQEKISQLTAEIGADNIPILLDIFLGELVTYESELAKQQGQPRVAYLVEISHSLKSSAASFGADKLCGFAKQIDQHAKQNEMALVEECLAEMQRILADTQAAYQAFKQAL